MKNKFKRLLALLLVCVMAIPSMNVFAALTSAIPNGSGGESQGAGLAGEAYAIGLGKCTEETYNGGSDLESLYTWVDGYSMRHYVNIEGGCYLLPANGEYSNAIPKVGNNRNVLSNSGDPLGILEAVKANSTNEYLYRTPNGRLAIAPEKVDEVMESLRTCNEALYEEWMSNRYGIGGNPVVIVVEMVAMSSHDACGYTVYDMGVATCGDYNIKNPNLADTMTTRNAAGGTWESSTAKAIFNSAQGMYKSNQVIYQIFDSMFGVRLTSGSLSGGSRWQKGIAALATGGMNDSSITGCYVISIGGFTEDKPPETGQYLFGVYEWDFDAPLLPANDRGHNEDSTKEIAKGSSVSGAFDFGYVNLKNQSAGTWKSWGEVYGGQSVDLRLEVYGLGQGNGVAEFSVDPNILMSKGGPNASGVISGLQAQYTKTGVPWDEFIDALTNGTPEGFQFDGMSGGFAPANFSATCYQGEIAIGYYTQLFVTPHASGGGSQNGQEIQFACNMVHYAVYTPKDETRTYKLQQTDLQGWSQLKDNGIASAQFEAMTGTPTTEDMFISMGGSEYLVNMQYALHVEDYKRTYELNVPAYDNFMYYEAGDGKPFDINQYQTNIYQLPSPFAKEWQKQTENPTKNLAYQMNVASASPDQNEQFMTSAKEFHDDIVKLFTDTIDENLTQGSGVYNEDDYGVLVKAKSLTLDDTWRIDGIDTAVVGSDRALVSDTKKKLRELSNYLVKLKREVDRGDYNRGYLFAKNWDPLKDLKITFMSLNKDYLDYDSDAMGAVSITFNYQCDSAEYENKSATYDNWWKCTFVAGVEEHSCAHGTGHEAVADHAEHLFGNYCQSVKTDNKTTSPTLTHSDGECEEKKDDNGVGTGEYDHGTWTASMSACPSGQHTHYGHNEANYKGTNKGIENSWDVPDYASSDEEFTPHTRNDEYWAATFGYGIEPNYEEGPNYIARMQDDDRGKTLFYEGTIEQVYKSVKFMDIVDCHVWRLSGGAAGNMDHLMVEETAAKNIMPIIEMACSNKGFTLYNTAPAEQKETFARTYTTPDGKTYDKVWTAVDEAFAELIEIDESIDEEPEWAANTELAAIGRLANSYNPGSSEEHQFFTSSKYGALDALTVAGEGDSLQFTYDIAEQGGKSHWSFDGFLKQAIANTFYDGEIDGPEGAYRNYILVQSDYLSLGDQPLTMSGFMWASKELDEGAGTKFDAEGNMYGTSQAILNTDKSWYASDLWRYCTKGTAWEPSMSVEETEVNIESEHADAALVDVKEGPGPRDGFGDTDTAPTNKTRPLGEYAEGPKELEDLYAEADNGNSMFVRLDMNDEYGSWTVNEIVSSTISGSIGMNANFDTEGKGGSGGSSLEFNGGIMPIVGYVGKYDSVEVDEHVYEPGDGGSTAFDPNATLVNGGFGGLTFDMYGNPNASSHLFVDTGASGVTGKQVSASGSPKNRVTNMGLMFPYYTGLNVIRWNPNDSYGGAETALVYDECLHFYEARSGVHSSEEKTLNALMLSGGIGQYKDSITTDLKQHGMFDDILNSSTPGISAGGNSIITGVSYGGPTKNSSGFTNNVVIFNPSAAENTKLVPMSELLPDGQNSYKSDEDQSGYVERDQRITETIVSNSESGDSYISYEDVDITDVTPTSKQYTFTLKDKTEYGGGITDPYTMEDYEGSQRDALTWTLEAGSEPFTVTSTGTYRMTLFDNAGNDTSVELKLEGGDQLTTDGTSVYLSRSSDDAPTVTYDQMTNSVAKYYMLIDSVVQSGEASMQESLVNNFIKNGRHNLETLNTKFNRLNYTWEVDASTLQQQRLNAAVTAANEVINDFNSTMRSLSFRYERSSNELVSGDYIYVLPNVYEDFEVLLSEYQLMVSRIYEYAAATGLTANLVEPLALRQFMLEEGDFMTPDGVDYEEYQRAVFEAESRSRDVVARVFNDADRQQAYSEAMLSVEALNAAAPSTSAQGRTFSSLVSEYNVFVTALVQTFNVSSDRLILNYAAGYDEMEQFLFDLNNLRTLINNISLRNGVGISVPALPTLELIAKEGKAATFKENDRFKVESGAVMTVDFTGLGMSKGSTLVFRMPFDKVYSDPANVTLSTDGSLLDFRDVTTGIRNTTGYTHTLYKYQDGNDWVYVIEALDDVRLGAMKFIFNNDAYIRQITEPYVKFDKIWLCDIGSAYSNPVYLGTTIEHNHYEAGSIYWNKATRTRSINKVLFDATGLEATITVNKKSVTLFISKESDKNVSLSQDAIDNPHKVYNADWRYYVIGWETEGGSKILSAKDPRLYVDTTVLKWPSSASGTVTVRELRNSACLVKFGGKVYLTLKEEGANHKILETGQVVSKYDWWTLGDTSTNLPERPINTATSGTFPLTPNAPAKVIGGADDGKLTYQDFKYEFFFSTLDPEKDAPAKPLFNVEFSKNIEYRFSSSDKRVDFSEEGNWSVDWERHEHTVSGVQVVVPGRGSGTANYVSLDDEFDVYFDNVGQFPGDGTKNVGGTNANLGYGWNANGIKLLGDGVNNGISDWYGGGDDGISEDEVVVDGNVTTRQTTECTGWIYAKYLIFNVDVYAFADSSGKVNPTLGAYNADGSQNTPVLVPAGSPVYLGEYLSGGTDFSNVDGAYQGDWFNKGGFYDYGAPDVTKDKYDREFLYHFWCPLYNGEMKDSMVVEFHTININDSAASGNAGADFNGYLTSGGSSGIGGRGYVGPSPNNKEDGTYSDRRHADNKVNTSIVGRIGALTISDTGDPRYSDSFKITDLTNDDISNYLIYPVVRKVAEYSNRFTGQFTGALGSQRGIVLDPFDVRGRICNAWMVEYVKSHHRDEAGHLDWTNYNYGTYATNSYNTYSTQWFKQTITRFDRDSSVDSADVQYAMALPLTPDFNKHETFKAKPLRVGYEVYLSMESIGNYFGESGLDNSGAWEEDNDNPETSNQNNDYGQNKVQVRPFYSAVDASSDAVSDYNGPVDVYMRSGDTYVLINSGCDKDKTTDTDAVCDDPEHSIAQVLSVMYTNFNPNYIETNTGDTVIELDQNMMRRMVTESESFVTRDVLNAHDDRKSILTKVDDSTGGIGGESLDIRYTYGCSQMLFLRDRNMTYVGGKTAALGWDNPVPEGSSLLNKEYAQKWYFGLGLPSSAVFVPHGEKLTDKTVLKTGIVINSIDVVISGHVWTLHYESEVSKMSFEYEGGVVNWDKWNPWHERYPWLIPVTYYNIGDTSTADLDTQGSH